MASLYGEQRVAAQHRAEERWRQFLLDLLAVAESHGRTLYCQGYSDTVTVAEPRRPAERVPVARLKQWGRYNDEWRVQVEDGASHYGGGQPVLNRRLDKATPALVFGALLEQTDIARRCYDRAREEARLQGDANERAAVAWAALAERLGVPDGAARRGDVYGPGWGLDVHVEAATAGVSTKVTLTVREDAPPAARALLLELIDQGRALAPRWEVLVGNLGLVYSGPREPDARKTFATYCAQSRSDAGRAGGETVALLRDGEIVEEHEGTLATEVDKS